MAEKDTPKKLRGPSTPEDYPTSSSQSFPSGDYTYTLEICMNLRESMGKVVEAVENLKKHSDKHSEILEKQGDKLSAIAKDIHAAKVVGTVLAVLAGVSGFLLKMAVDYFSRRTPPF